MSKSKKNVYPEVASPEQKNWRVPTVKINSRRYLGNKFRLLPFITSVIANECGNFKTFADIFAGTGAVASVYTNKKLITNDILYSNYICHIAWFSNEPFDAEKVCDYIKFFNSDIPFQENYMTQNFSGTYFSEAVCSKIGVIRECIEKDYCDSKINPKERALLIASLIYGMDRIATTCGHYDAYRKNAEHADKLLLSLPVLEDKLKKNKCYNTDANILAKSIKSDITYIDPPYNSRQYGDAYHLIENIARWGKPEVFGVAKKMDRSTLKSKYCTREAPSTFYELVNSLDTRYIVVSYNNMAKKGNDRSNARITDAEILDTLQSRGKVKVFSERFKPFTTGKSDRGDNEERLFVCRCK